MAGSRKAKTRKARTSSATGYIRRSNRRLVTAGDFVDQAAKTKLHNQNTCVFCKRLIVEEENEIFGQREFSAKHVAHYFCMLLSSHLPQRGEDDEGIKGFLDIDIAKELRRSQKDKCCYCMKKGANVRCANASCKRVFHFPCAHEVGAIPNFVPGAYDVLCSEHAWPQMVVPLIKQDGTAECLVCLEQIQIDVSVAVPPDLLVSPCCRQLYEKRCLRGYANVAGLHHFRCCQCRNSQQFLYACQRNGIFVPNQDAEWEQNDAFADHYIPHNVCDVPNCLCPSGRGTIDDNPDWEVVRCDDCGKSGTHIKCSNLQDGPMSEFRCQDCEPMRSSSINASVPLIEADKGGEVEMIELDDDTSSDDSDVVVVSSTYTREDILRRQRADLQRLEETYGRFRSVVVKRLIERLKEQRRRKAAAESIP